MKLKKVIVHKYKSFESDQEFEVRDDITILVGMNESGKTSVLESIAKTRYFQEDKKFKFNVTHDYPRREKKSIDKSGENPKAITCYYTVDSETVIKIEKEFGIDVLKNIDFSITTKYDNKRNFSGVDADLSKFLEFITKKLNFYSKTIVDKLLKVKNNVDFDKLIAEYKDDTILTNLETLRKYFKNSNNWSNPIEEYIANKILSPNLPKFLYYDEYYSLPSRIIIENMIKEDIDVEEMKTAKALLELADLDPEEILEAKDFEDYIAELEATEAIISDELFKYWSTNDNLSIEFKIEAKEEKVTRKAKDHYNHEEIIEVNIVEHILDIRVKNQRTRVSLPLKNRSKGFNWFFSFLVWFKKIQEDNNSKYILLLDEPGLNLHASAQSDMLRFLEDLSENYQIIYTTHSPFSIPTDKLERVRTVLETEKGSRISDSIQEKDPNTLFPLQAALGYDIAQNLFIGKKNLLIEGVSDLVFLTSISSLFEQNGKEYIDQEITLVPTGGLEKVSTFISLLRGSKLEIACLLDSFTDPKGRAKFENIINQKLIHKNKVRFFNEYLIDYSQADIEDLFNKEDYLKLFNKAFTEHSDISLTDLDSNLKPTLLQINKHLGIKRFNHYQPALELSKGCLKFEDLSLDTISNFEKLFNDINKLLK
ncbi:AAA family ATPase [Sphingobacterium corticis]|uniref:AAA family ATPase n=1 Tax=Sphingobacterium corticis TaxID=1812823 RepID=A0ABW5NKI5_9SPHI